MPTYNTPRNKPNHDRVMVWESTGNTVTPPVVAGQPDIDFLTLLPPPHSYRGVRMTLVSGVDDTDNGKVLLVQNLPDPGGLAKVAVKFKQPYPAPGYYTIRVQFKLNGSYYEESLGINVE